MDFDYFVCLILWLFGSIVVESGVAGLTCHVGGEPFDALEVEDALHVEVVYGEFDFIALANLGDGLDVGSAHDYLTKRPL